MILLILGGLLLMLSPVIAFCLMLYFSNLQSSNLDLYDEYEEKIREIFIFGFIITPLIALFIIILGVLCLNT